MKTYAEFSIFTQPAAPLPPSVFSLFTLWDNGAVRVIETHPHKPEIEAAADQSAPAPTAGTAAQAFGPVEVPTADVAPSAEAQNVETVEYQVIVEPELAESPAENSTAEADPEDVFERFVQNPPPRRRGEPDVRLDEAVERSIEEDEEIVTETMALISLRQGNRTEAIRIYSKLRLLFPEKAPYFDAQIEKIQGS